MRLTCNQFLLIFCWRRATTFNENSNRTLNTILFLIIGAFRLEIDNATLTKIVKSDSIVWKMNTRLICQTSDASIVENTATFKNNVEQNFIKT